jgi:mRNA interferase RelE/StbE
VNVILREVKYHKDAEKFMLKTDKETFERIVSAIEDIRKLPPVGDIKKLKGQDDTYRSRAGKYRIIYKIIDNVVFVRDIGSRGQIYKGGN